jgi:hypothetical protein
MSADLADHVTIDEAFHILWPAMRPHEARHSLSTAITTDTVCLLANGVKVPADWFENHLQIGAKADTTGQWTAELRMSRIGVQNFYETEWAVSRSDVMALLAEKTKSSKRTGGKPPRYDSDEIRAAAFVALINHLKKGTIPKDYSGNDLVVDVAEILGDRSPGDTLLKEVLNPLLKHIKLRLNSGR